jgi:hypothetical protein
MASGQSTEKAMSVVDIKEHNFKNWLGKQINLAKNQRVIIPSVLVTPEDAGVVLENNDGNRNLNSRHVEVLANSMSLGEWVETGDTIKLDRSGRLLDGQHRLMAVRASGVSAKFDFAFGVATEAFDRIDVGRGRTAGNIFEIAGYTNGTTLASAAKVLMAVESGFKTVRSVNASKHEILSYAQKCPDLGESAKIAKEISRNIGKAGSVAGLASGVYKIRQRMGESEPQEFFTKVSSGIGLLADSPILAFRNRCIRSADGRPLDAVDVAALLIKAFNFWHEGRVCKVLTWRSVDEDFPIVGS